MALALPTWASGHQPSQEEWNAIWDAIEAEVNALSAGTADGSGQLTKSVAGGSHVTLTADEAKMGNLEFTGVLTANISVIVPVTPHAWLVKNATTGAFTLTVKTAAGTGIAVTQGSTKLLACDGTNVIDKESSGGSGAPTAATYITQTPDSGLSNEQALSTLGTGYMKSTTGTGVVSTTAGIPSADISDAASAATASVVMRRDANGRTQVADPSASADVATKNYVDSVASGLDAKQSVRAATTANITLSAPQTIDGVSVIAGDRVLVKDQTTGSQNGIYVCAAGAWSRATDADASAEVTGGMYCFVTEGTTNGDKGWVLATNDPITLGTTALVFTQFTGAAGGGEANTASNVGAGGVGLFKQKSSLDLQFRNINAGSSKVSVALDAANNEVDIDVAVGTTANTVAVGNDARFEQPHGITIPDPTNAEKIPIFRTNRQMTVTEIASGLVGSSTPSVTFSIHYGADLSAAGTKVKTANITTTSVTGGDTTSAFDNAVIPADNIVWITTTAKSGTVTYLWVTIHLS